MCSPLEGREGLGLGTNLIRLMQTIQAIMEWYRPGAVILQCGADSLAEDKLGVFNLSMRGNPISALTPSSLELTGSFITL